MEEEKRTNNKPPRKLVVQLFLFMMLVFQMIGQLFTSFKSILNDPFNLDDRGLNLIWLLVNGLAYIYSFLAIYKSLQRKTYSVLMLKLSVFYILLALFVRFLRAIPTISVPLLLLPSAIAVLFCFVFYMYLFRSKKLRIYLPKEERTVGIWGWVGFAIYITAISLLLWVMKGYIQLWNHSKPLPVEEVMTTVDEVTDGVVAFTPGNSWEQDSIIVNEDNRYQFLYFSSDSCRICISSAVGECKSRIDYYQILCQVFNSDNVILNEIAYMDTLIEGRRCYSNTYSCLGEGDTIYWTFSSLKDKDSFKILTFFSFGKNIDGQSNEEIVKFMQNVRFQLEKRSVMN